jgi:predicted phage terminase large subunit-like protein
MKTKPPSPPDSPDFTNRFVSALKGDWRARARPEQLPPADFSIWLFMAGRGSGKNWADSHFVQEQGALGAIERIALIGATADSVRQTMVEGAAGILAAAGDRDRPVFEASKGQLTWPSGTIALCYSADSPELLRGPEFGLAWCDELASWRRDRETWDNLAFCMRGSKSPKIIISTTPRPTKLIKELVARAGSDGVVVSKSSTYDNRANLPPSFFSHLVKKYEGTRTGRQELLAELLTDTPGSLWTSENLEITRVEHAPQSLQRVVVAIDPSGSSAEGADEAGIIVAGLGADSHAYVLADLSGRMSPTEWARKAIDAYRVYKADRIIAETNFGAAMVLETIRSVDPGVPTKAITSSRGKVLRAEPISALFEQSRCHLVGNFPQLEDQLTSFTSDYDRARDGSPDRLDAMVFAIAELTSGAAPGGYFNEAALLVNGEPDVVPACVQNLFGVLATTDRTGAAVSFMIFGTSPSDVAPRLHLVDWRIAEMDQALSIEWLSACYASLLELSKEWKALSGPPEIFVEMDDYGQAAFELCWFHMETTGQAINLSKIERRRKQPIPTLDQRVEACRAKINGGGVKLARPAFEREEAFRSSHANHFLTQLRKFSPEARDAPVELVTALCIGVGLWNGNA